MKSPTFWYKTTSFLAYLLWPLGSTYGLIVRIKSYFTRPKSFGIPIICVGNLTLGGAGKTPVALSLGKYFLSTGKKVGFLSRGYKGRLKGPIQINRNYHTAEKVGDEPLLLAQTAPTWIAKDRASGAREMIRRGINLIIMDDGHQNHSFKKTINFVVIDGTQGIGNGQVFPSGPLREFKGDGARRANAFIVIGKAHPFLKEFLQTYEKPCFQATIEPSPTFLDSFPQNPKKASFFAFAGIGNPQKFFDALKQIGLTLAGTKSFPDHHAYRPKEWNSLVAEARRRSATLITTEKDFVRLTKVQQKSVVPFPIEIKWSYWNKVVQYLKDNLDDPHTIPKERS